MINGKKGFTLVELLVVMAILAILTTLLYGGFRSAQLRGRDAQRKSDLKQIGEALELFFSDYRQYPPEVNGNIAACPFDPVSLTGTPCTWGTSELTDGKTTYFKTLPADPASSQNYRYRLVPASAGQKYQIFARLENSQDPDCLGGDCANSPVSYSCGSGICNFAKTSVNASPTE